MWILNCFGQFKPFGKGRTNNQPGMFGKSTKFLGLTEPNSGPKKA